MSEAGAEAVLDASAILALVGQEPGADVVATTLREALCSAVNWAEVAERVLAAGGEPTVLRARLEPLGSVFVAFDVRQAEVTASLRQPVRSASLSLGDRACLALGRLRQLPVFTADRSWSELAGLGIEVRLIR